MKAIRVVMLQSATRDTVRGTAWSFISLSGMNLQCSSANLRLSLSP